MLWKSFQIIFSNPEVSSKPLRFCCFTFKFLIPLGFFLVQQVHSSLCLQRKRTFPVVSARGQGDRDIESVVVGLAAPSMSSLLCTANSSPWLWAFWRMMCLLVEWCCRLLSAKARGRASFFPFLATWIQSSTELGTKLCFILVNSEASDQVFYLSLSFCICDSKDTSSPVPAHHSR